MKTGFSKLKDSHWLREQYVSLTTRQIAVAVGCSKPMVLRALKFHGITPRTRTEYANRITPKRGYHKMTAPDGRFMIRSRYVMEQHLGRRLKSHEHVHHKDQNRENDAIENLQLLTQSDHMRLHREQLSRNAHQVVQRRYTKTCGCCRSPYLGTIRQKRCLDCRDAYNRAAAQLRSTAHYYAKKKRHGTITASPSKVESPG